MAAFRGNAPVFQGSFYIDVIASLGRGILKGGFYARPDNLIRLQSAETH